MIEVVLTWGVCEADRPWADQLARFWTLNMTSSQQKVSLASGFRVKVLTSQQIIAQLNASWIWVPKWVDSSTENTAGRVVTFIRELQLPSKPKEGVFHLSADTRYKLFINDQRVAVGPSRGSPYLWYHDTIDIAVHLQEGHNEIRVEVLRYFAANRAAMPFDRTSFPGLTIHGTIAVDGETLEINSGEVGQWRAQVHNEITFPTGIIDDGFLHVQSN
ncbi:hypothetical protein PRZ48_008524 [Zasmidium cellare]|uniref:Uncharacterized protein n=1 Tax=Zasmidium cellare TaxID=395010 RepID=A0ABR0EGC2_ZASCE|nr:hypothetical protein PRZ48_008524 [Zasmidium cellare]